MATLTPKKRKSLPKKDFGIPGKRAYPMPDKEHAKLAKSGASRAEHLGNISKAQEKKIDAKANRIIKGKKGKKR